jgi:putative oxidoreductase
MEYIILLGRILLGGFFIYGGYNHIRNLEMVSGYAQSKGVPSPKAASVVSGVLLLIGGLSVLLGVYPDVGVIALVLFLAPVSFKMHAFWKVQDPMAKMGERVNFQKNIAILGAVLILLAIPQPWSLSLF